MEPMITMTSVKRPTGGHSEGHYLLPLAAAYGASVLKVFEDSTKGSAMTELNTELRKLEFCAEQSTGEARWEANAILEYLRKAVS